MISATDFFRDKKAFEALANLLLEQYAPPCIIINEEYDIVHLSARATPYLQFTGDEISQNLLRLVRQELRPVLRPALYQAMRQKTAVEVKGLSVKLEDRAETINMHVKPVLREEDIARGFILVLFERTGQEPTGRENTVRQSNEFIAIASHELKTPVTSIKVYGEVLRERLEKIKDNENAELVNKLNNQVERLSNLIADLLDATNIEEGQLPLKLTVFDINELISERVEEAKHLSKDHVFIVNLDKPQPVNADRKRIGQVLTNLLSNAAKYSPAGSEITITARITKNGITVSVQDNGIGIPANMRNNVFDRFFRISNTQTYPGMGLGLYISAGIIERHGGTISVESIEGKGSTFYFTLPGNSQ